MGWQRVWPGDATESITIKCTPYQRMRWNGIARRYGWAHVGPWIVKAADMLWEQVKQQEEEHQLMPEEES